MLVICINGIEYGVRISSDLKYKGVIIDSDTQEITLSSIGNGQLPLLRQICAAVTSLSPVVSGRAISDGQTLSDSTSPRKKVRSSPAEPPDVPPSNQGEANEVIQPHTAGEPGKDTP